MSTSRLNFTEAVYAADAVIQRISPDQLDAPTPCDGWNVRDLIAHMCGPLAAISHMAETGEVADPTQSVVGDDQIATWNACRQSVLGSLDRPGATETVGEFWFGESSINDILDFALWDPLVHSWDLAVATGQKHAVTDEIVATGRAVVEPNAEMLRGGGMMADPVALSPDASAKDQFLALTGRDPRV